jgi:hypothetical protein
VELRATQLKRVRYQTPASIFQRAVVFDVPSIYDFELHPVLGIGALKIRFERLEYDPEKWQPVSRKYYAKKEDEIMMRLNPLRS